MPARTFINQDGSSNKFWTIDVSGTEHTVQYGRIGTAGQVKTKGFADTAKAVAAAEKLIAEKLAKGYVEDGTATPPPASAGARSAPSVAAPATPSVPARAAPPAPAPATAPLRSGIALRADEWALATWRPLADPPGEPPPFDRTRAAAALKQAKALEYGGRWSWREPPFTGALTAEEATAWLRLSSGRFPADAARAMAKHGHEPLSEADALHHAATSSLPPGLALSALLDVLDATRVAEWMLAEKSGVSSRWGGDELRGDLALGVRASLLPRLDRADRERFTEEVRDALDGVAFPTDLYQPPPLPFLLAAQAGLHDELQHVVDAWPDDKYRGETWVDHYHRPQAVVLGLGSPEAVQEAFTRLQLRLSLEWHVAGWLAHTELAALDFVVDRIAKLTNRDEAEAAARTFANVHDPAAAPHMLELMRTSKAAPVAREWLADHPLEAAVGLARSLTARARPEVVEYLRTRKRAGDDLAAALPHLDDPTRFKELVLDHEDHQVLAELPPALRAALDAAPKKKLPAWVDPAALPPIGLQASDVDALLRILAAGDPVPPGLEDTDAFGWALFETWLSEGAPSKDKWALLALGTLGSDASATRLAPLIRAWPGESQHARAVLALGVLGAIGTDTSLMLLSGIAEKVKFKALQQRAREAMDEIAAAKGMTKAELEDRIVPECGLDEHGSRTFEIGGKTYSFALGPGMKPMLRDAGGKLRALPPKPSDEWKLLRKQVSDVAKIQAARLEQAMVTQRRWSVEDFERFIVHHPLQRHLAKLLVWRAGEQTFRVTDELDYADAEDEPVSLSGEVGLVHPLQLADDERAAWGELLADYEIVPPFAQLGRPVHELEERDARERILTRFEHRKVGASTLVRVLENLGWQRGAAFDNGIFTLHAKAFPALGVTAVVQYDGIPMGYMVDWEDQALEKVYVLDLAVKSAHELGWGDPHDAVGRKLAWGDVDPIVCSEVLADVATVLEKAR